MDDLVSPPTRVLVAPDAAPDAPEDHGEPIMSAGSQLGCIVVEGGSSRMTTVDRYLVADAARLVAIELRRQQAVDEAESTFRGTLLEELVDLPDGASGARARIALRLQQAGLDLLRVTPLIALQAVDTAIDPTYVLRRVRDGAARLSGQMVSKVLAFERAGRIVLATHSSDGDSMVRNLASQLASHLADVGLPVLVGVSGSTTNVADAHLQAITCLQILRDRGDDGGVLRAEDLGPLAALLSVPDLGQSRSFVSEVLGELVATDRTMRIPLLETFVAYIESDGTRSSLADRLYIHPSTLKYRLGIVESVVGPSIADPDAALRFQTAVTTLRILEARGASPFSADQRPATEILEQRS
ncbi:PucR family transcriptional regulator [Patulibacter medicamentivorans]|uniref:PucR family transcriptional regulator n=1 Tax=Patulibacter medicamentivorans TaxID=1097667 RepID=UPI001110FA22|nr:PucR family transcriptional regulator [Patulibacter medicamentivorans]